MPVSSVGQHPEQMLRLARAGDGEALGHLLELYRNYLTLLARLQIDRRLQGKVDASDLVQEAFLKAHGNFGQFRGATEGQLISWLRRILATTLVSLVRHYVGRRRRDDEANARAIGEGDRVADFLLGCDPREKRLALVDDRAERLEHEVAPAVRPRGLGIRAGVFEKPRDAIQLGIALFFQIVVRTIRGRRAATTASATAAAAETRKLEGHPDRRRHRAFFPRVAIEIHHRGLAPEEGRANDLLRRRSVFLS